MGQTRVDPRNHMEVHFDATRRIRSNSSCAATMQLCQITLTTYYAAAHLMNKIVGIMFSGCPSLCACMQIRASLHTSQPLYLSELISHYLSSRCVFPIQISLPDHGVLLATFPLSRAFSVSAPSTWNTLPAHIRSVDTLSTFKRHLKFHPFQPAFTV